MGKLITIWESISRHKYWIIILAFGAIVGFLDKSSMIHHIGYAHETNCLQGGINKYCAEYEENTERLNELSTSPEAIGQMVHEKYLVKKPNEDVYVFDGNE